MRCIMGYRAGPSPHKSRLTHPFFFLTWADRCAFQRGARCSTSRVPPTFVNKSEQSRRRLCSSWRRDSSSSPSKMVIHHGSTAQWLVPVSLGRSDSASPHPLAHCFCLFTAWQVDRWWWGWFVFIWTYTVRDNLEGKEEWADKIVCSEGYISRRARPGVYVPATVCFCAEQLTPAHPS